MPRIVFRSPSHTVTSSWFHGIRIINNATGKTQTPDRIVSDRLAKHIKTLRQAGYDLKRDAAAISAVYMWLIAVTDGQDFSEGVELLALRGDGFLDYFRAVYVQINSA